MEGQIRQLAALKVKLARRGDDLAAGIASCEKGEAQEDGFWLAVQQIGQGIGWEAVRAELVGALAGREKPHRESKSL